MTIIIHTRIVTYVSSLKQVKQFTPTVFLSPYMSLHFLILIMIIPSKTSHMMHILLFIVPVLSLGRSFVLLSSSISVHYVYHGIFLSIVHQNFRRVLLDLEEFDQMRICVEGNRGGFLICNVCGQSLAHCKLIYCDSLPLSLYVDLLLRNDRGDIIIALISYGHGVLSSRTCDITGEDFRPEYSIIICPCCLGRHLPSCLIGKSS